MTDSTKRTRVRWLIIAVLFIITTINYADRATFSIAGQSASKELGLDPVAMGFQVVAFIHVAMEKGHIREMPRFRDLIADIPEVLECYSVTGDFDYEIKIIAHDLKSLSVFLMNTLMPLPGVSSVRTSVCLDEIKCTSALPLPE